MAERPNPRFTIDSTRDFYRAPDEYRDEAHIRAIVRKELRAEREREARATRADRGD